MSFPLTCDTQRKTHTAPTRGRATKVSVGVAAATFAAMTAILATPANAAQTDVATAQAQLDEANNTLTAARQTLQETVAGRESAQQKASELQLEAQQASRQADEATRSYLRLLREGTPSITSLVTQALTPTDNPQQNLLSGLTLADKASNLFNGNTNVSDLVTNYRYLADEKTTEAGAAETAVSEIPVADTENAVAAAEADVEGKRTQLELAKDAEAEEQARAAREAASNDIAPTGASVTPTSGGWVKPVAGKLSSGFGKRPQPVPGVKPHHDGADFSAPSGTSIVAASAGKVVEAGYQGSYGNWVLIDHGNGLKTGYAHMLDGGIKVSVGQQVEAGQLIGLVGSTGASTGPHLHFEVRTSGMAVAGVNSNGMFLDPVAFLAKQGIQV